MKDGISRRDFLTYAGVLGATSLTDCIRRPVEKILPYAKRPEELIPGQPLFFATSFYVAGEVLGVLVESFDGRPTKVEGNPQHPASLGKTSRWAQAELLSLYDPDRLQRPQHQGAPVAWDDFWAFADPHFVTLAKDKGRTLAVLVDQCPSPTRARLLTELFKKYPEARLYQHDLHASPAQEPTPYLSAGTRAVPDYGRADIVLSLDSDFLGVEPGVVRATREFVSHRKIEEHREKMNRLYSVSPLFNLTALNADHHLSVAGLRVGTIAYAVVFEILAHAANKVDAAVYAALQKQAQPELSSQERRFVRALVRDFGDHRGSSLAVAGYRQPPIVHALAHVINQATGNLGRTTRLTEDPRIVSGAHALGELATDLRANRVTTVLRLGDHALCSAPAELHLAELLEKAPVSIALSFHAEPSASPATWQLAQSHVLEAWGDLAADDGTSSLVQPLIAPIFDTWSDIELLSRLLGEKLKHGYGTVKDTWRPRIASADFETHWERWLHDGVIDQNVAKRGEPKIDTNRLAAFVQAAPTYQAQGPLELNFCLDDKVLDGRYANNPWMQELPHPVTKLTWDNALTVAPRTAQSLGLTTGNLVSIEKADRRLTAAVLIAPGQAEGTLALALGYGRTHGGRFSREAGFDANELRHSASPWMESGFTVTRRAGTYTLAISQQHASMEGRPLVAVTSIEDLARDPRAAVPQDETQALRRALWPPPNQTEGMQWGMVIDLNACTGCGACVLACQAENSISVVGKDQVSRGRILHWLRVDRYFTGREDSPPAVVQPVPCQQCEMAPCESVCPVAATSHTPEGLNDQVYNRCVGTRYCSNNCPYKVRRFNYFNYTEDLTPLEKMVKNPNVTVRLRGVMEKCTYCVQRIQQARIHSLENHGGGQIAEGQLQTACQQVCPAGAIAFGNINDPASEVARLKRSPRNYTLLTELNTRPRTSYLAKIKNPNPELET